MTANAPGVSVSTRRCFARSTNGSRRSRRRGARHLQLVCECGHRDCAERITLTIDEYRKLRSDPLQFAVLPGHEIPQVEDVVQRMSGWLIVQKQAGEPAAVARATDD